MNRRFLTGLFCLFSLALFAEKRVEKGVPNALPPDSLSNLEAFFAAQKIDAQKSREGIFYRIEKAGEGPAPRPGDWVKVHYEGRLLNGKIFDATRSATKNEPFVFQFGFRQVVPGLDAGIGLLKTGGKATFFIPNRLAYGNAAVGAVIPSGAALIFEAELLEIMTPAAYEQYIADLEEREKMEFEQQKKQQAEADAQLLDSYEKAQNLKAEHLPSGLRIVIEKPGKGPKPQKGQQLSVEYEGFLLNGEPFESGSDARKLTFKIGEGRVIDGWDEGLLRFGAGGAGWLLIPSGLAYGPLAIDEEGGAHVPANSCLAFRVKVEAID